MPAHETRFEELKRYVDFSRGDADLLRSFHCVAAPHFDRIAQEFYDRIRHHEDAHAVFTGEAQIARLQQALVLWMERLFGGIYDEAYFAGISKIGRVHVKVGLPQRYMFTAMALIRTSLTQIAESHQPNGPGIASAISRLLDLELAIMVESYREDFIARIQRIERMEQKALGASLARTEQRYFNAVEVPRVLIVGLDANGLIRLFNREAERVTGFARDEVLGTALVESLGMDDSGDATRMRAVLAAYQIAHAGNCGAVVEPPREPPREPPLEPPLAAPLETLIQTRSGHSRLLLWQISFAPSEGDEVCIFAFGRDTTDEKAMLARTQQQDKLAAIGTLAAGLAHEIRNPLNGAQLHVTYLSRSLKRANAHPELVEAIATVADEITRLGNLVTEFLAFARPKPLFVKPLAVRTLLERVSQVAAQGTGRHTPIALDIQAASMEILADGDKLEQVLLNLTQNAIEALADADQGRVILRARRQPRTVTIEVEDNGPGIAPETPVFDAFFSTKPQGTGLGLSISHRIVTTHGGTLDVDSRSGRTIFRVVLPIDGPPGTSQTFNPEPT